MRFITPSQTDEAIAARARRHLEEVVRIDSSSDERSDTIPSTPGQKVLADHLAGFFAELGATVERDEHANVIATLPARGARAAEPIALLIHVDTARGTHTVPHLQLRNAWDGTRIDYPENKALDVSVANYPALTTFLGLDLLHGPGDAPFGLDDKLGLTHLMTLAWLLATNPEIPHPTLLLIGRPDEEIGRMEALSGLAAMLEARGVRSGYTIDGIEPYEINVENFNASQGSIFFEPEPLGVEGGQVVEVFIGGVNTHGATARAEGHRPATRLAAEVFAALTASGHTPERIRPLCFASDPERDCDALLHVHIAEGESVEALRDTLGAVVGPHKGRGASFSVEPFEGDLDAKGATLSALAFVESFLHSDPGFTLRAEDSESFDGYSQPYRILPDTGGRLRLDVRLRDFDPDALALREQHVRDLASQSGRCAEVRSQYVNMGPRLADRPELIAWPKAAGAPLGLGCQVLPIRGGTGVDPFLDKGVAIANLGTGYFAPESEKEFTSLQHMVGHARWLINLVQVIAQSPSSNT